MNPQLNPSDLDVYAWFPIFLFLAILIPVVCGIWQCGSVAFNTLRTHCNARDRAFEGDDAGCFDSMEAASSVAPEYGLADTPRWIYAAQYQQERADRARWN